jgi:hypothetical protein
MGAHFALKGSKHCVERRDILVAIRKDEADALKFMVDVAKQKLVSPMSFQTSFLVTSQSSLSGVREQRSTNHLPSTGYYDETEDRG